ncbi:winged helix-turn-helix domain-containing protein [Rhodococcus rhodochrous]|uniref:winged helix-turn-helix domain-containing protein n=1 Tax=Rhodococcus rhodochrous TaxID=1829 RepID=UPI0011AA829B|nr:winged helix-turn-helix domain-containing protein [Rhodococcus rhodochrous]TWH44385.1 Response regulators consisting of a CheY-like receiver domain and a winged-helix DNA-binding domain [Rhodococcus rhodochrous J38]
MSAHPGDRPRDMVSSRRPRTGASAVFPVPRQRLAIVGPEPDHPAVLATKRIADKLGWPHLVVTDRNKLVWAVTVNKPALVTIVGDADDRTYLDDIGPVRAAYKGPIAVLDALPPQLTVTALVDGADSVLQPDLRDDELGARLLALVRRTAEGSESGARYLTSGGLKVDLWRKEATLDRTPLNLSSTEYRLLVCLMESAGQTLPWSRILHRVWGWADADVNMLRIYITRLRKALGETAASSTYIKSVRGHGYMFARPVIEAADSESDTVDGELPMMQRLAAKCTELATATDITGAASRIAESLVAEGTVDAVGLHLSDGQALRLVGQFGFTTEWEQVAGEIALADDRYASIESVRRAQPVQLLRNRSHTFPGTNAAVSSNGPGTYLFVPISHAGETIGSLGVVRRSDEPFGPLTISYLQAVAALCGACLGPQWNSARS